MTTATSDLTARLTVVAETCDRAVLAEIAGRCVTDEQAGESDWQHYLTDSQLIEATVRLADPADLDAAIRECVPAV